jgi:hypothetical protein
MTMAIYKGVSYRLNDDDTMEPATDPLIPTSCACPRRSERSPKRSTKAQYGMRYSHIR